MGGSAERNPMKGGFIGDTCGLRSPVVLPLASRKSVLLTAIECAAANSPAECPIGEGARGNIVGPGFGLPRRVSWACTGKRREFRDTEVLEDAGRSRGNAPTGRADEQIRWKAVFHRKTLKVPSEGSQKRAVDVPGRRVNDAWESAQRREASCAPRCGRAPVLALCLLTLGLGALAGCEYGDTDTARVSSRTKAPAAGHRGRTPRQARCDLRDQSDAGPSAYRRGQLAAAGPSLLTTSGVRAGRPSGNSSTKLSFANSGAPGR